MPTGCSSFNYKEEATLIPFKKTVNAMSAAIDKAAGSDSEFTGVL